MISRQIKAGTQLIIALDRTQWKKYNVLMVSAIYQKRTFLIFGTLCGESLDREENLAKLIKRIGYNYENGGGSTSLKKALASREKEAWGLTVLR